ncbi:MAG: GIY-YIG nuclease family protein [Phenylobacterium sp.]|uniref:GIY-YIG nuclease family protein n=1 Tax=Phenylobacterium sp. TaxID=1871053 RepID=UPI001211D881|nr:GIY-YIG nuclease family protein [Phenylobacterium sp.]TAJ71655.1 MAG: GIY-YIG nuclease family protein [Phenylobacterium sp.]
MDKQSRREAIRDYKEKRSVPGVYAVRCAPSGQVWVAGSRNLGAQQNGLWFSLRTGGHANRTMQAAWNAHGEGAFAFEVLESIDDEDLTPLGRADAIKSRERHWLATLGATKAVG